MLFGLPVWLAFRRFQIQSIFAFALGGALIGFITYIPLPFLFGFNWTYVLDYTLDPSRWANLPNVTAVVGGLFAGILFGAIAFRLPPPRSPDEVKYTAY